MRQLVIDTATEALSVALFTDGRLTDFHHEIAGRGHAEKLMPVIAAMDEGGRADEIIVDSGPGSFTGVRVGLAAARALAYAWQARLRAYESLMMIAAMAREADEGGSDDLTVALTGGHGELFWRSFDRATLAPRSATASTPIPLLAQEVTATVIHGTGASALVGARGHGTTVSIHPDARCLPLLPADALRTDTTPLYGRGADAVPLAARKG